MEFSAATLLTTTNYCLLRLLTSRPIMGCNASSMSIFAPYLNLTSLVSPEDLKDFSILGLSIEEIKRFTIEFNKYCVHDNALASMIELTVILDIPMNQLTVGLLNSVSSSRKELNFKEFVINIWRFLIQSPDMLASSVYDIYIPPGQSHLNLEATRGLIHQIQGGVFPLSSEINEIVAKIELSPSNKVSKDEFMHTIKKHPRLLKPVLILQV